jgi:hypothetical protein
MGGACSTSGGYEKFIKDIREYEGKTPHGRPRRRW